MKLISILSIIVFVIFPSVSVIFFGVYSLIPFFLGACWTAVQQILYKLAKDKGEL